MRLAELLAPLATASDTGAMLPPETALRTALIGVGLGRALGMPPAARSDLLYAGVLRHLGCSTTAHEETRLMGDEQELRSSFNGVDAGSPVAMLRGASRGFAKGRPLARRARVVAGFMLAAPSQVPRIFTARCEVATRLGRRLGLTPDTVRALEETYERFDGKGQPGGIRGEALSPVARVLAVSEVVAMYLPLPGGEATAWETLSRRSGREFDPKVVKALLEGREEVLAPARRDAPLAALLDAEPLPHRAVDELDVVAQALADFADMKSTFTLGHSRRVAATARRAGEALGLTAAEARTLELAGWMHDVGRIAVSNAIWDKPGPLDAGEWDKVRAHPQVTERVLRAAPAFAEVARLAAAAHERMDGGGYPRGVAPALPARVLAAADVLAALGEPRPHRPAHAPEQRVAILVAEAESGRLDRAAVNAGSEAAGHPGVRAALPRGLTEREVEVLRLLARGLVDKEVASQLGISHRTVHHHNQSIFGKLEVTTRGAAALFAAENGLL